MPREDLQRWLVECKGFQSRLRAVVLDSVAGQFKELDRVDELREVEHDWRYLLLCASLLAGSEDPRAEDAALRIAQHCLVHPGTDGNERDAAAVVLDALTNSPAIRLAESRKLLEPGYIDRIPGPMQQDHVRRALRHRIFLSNGESLDANRFQYRFWDQSERADWLSVSAPTSAGKSYILKRWIEEVIRVEGRIDVVYVVPTRALIQEVEDDLRGHFAGVEYARVAVSSVPTAATLQENASNVLVFTQERLHLLMSRVSNQFVPQVLIVDEAQKIGDGHRGVLLQQVLDEVLRRNQSVRVVYASPMTQNPEVLLSAAPAGAKQGSIASEEQTVNQNLLWVSQVRGMPDQWDVELRADGDSHKLGAIPLQNRPGSDSKRLTFVAHAMSQGVGGNIIYVNGAADAEKTALQLWDLVGKEQDISNQQPVRDLIELVRHTIHPKYLLAQALSRGIGFHYGNMPLLVRKEVERLFREGVLHYLVCTSTLLEGVNLPCRSVFARGPRRGKKMPMSPSDFWNLAGRAGRWGKEFQGNIVCIDPKETVWKDGVPERRVKQIISTPADRIRSMEAEIVQFVREGTPRSAAAKNPELEHLASYLANARMQYGAIVESPVCARTGVELATRLDEALAGAVDELEVPEEILIRNPGISPLAMQSLLEYFARRRGPVAELVPVPPESEDAAAGYTAIFKRINNHLAEVFGAGGRVFQCALLTVNWMRGYPLSRMITSWIGYLERKGREYQVATEIRKTMEAVEQVARYLAPKYLSCYLDLVTHHLEGAGETALLERIPDVSLLLEFGVSQQTQMSLMSLGLSRTTTITVSDLIARDDLTMEEALSWIADQDWDSIELPRLAKREIVRMMTLANQPPE